MEIDIGHGGWKDLQQLRSDILAGNRTAGVKKVEKLLMKELAATIAAERRRGTVEDDMYALDEMIVSVDLKVVPWACKSSDPKRPRGEISLIAQLDDALAEKRTKRRELLTW
jgi:hypothetical protein